MRKKSLITNLQKYFKKIKKIISKNKTFYNILGNFFRFVKYPVIAIIFLHQLLFIIIFFYSVFLNFVNPKFTSLMIYRNLKNKQKNEKIVFIPLKHISNRVINNVIGIEDFKFYKHIGIDPEAIAKAYSTNKKLGFKYSGGSTITQQLARTLLLTPDKNYFRKYLEILISLEFNLFINKKRILELYLNYIEFGNGIYGIGRASYSYYNKSFYKLDNDEINKLITIIPNPIKYNPFNFYINQRMLTRYYILTSWSS